MTLMKQASLGLSNSTKRTRKREFLAGMEGVVPWSALVELVAPFVPEGRRGRPPFSVETMLRIHFMKWFTLSDSTMKLRQSTATPPTDGEQSRKAIGINTSIAYEDRHASRSA